MRRRTKSHKKNGRTFLVANESATTSRFRQLRESAGLTVDQLATKARMARAMIYHLEAGTRKPSLETARKIAKALGKSLAEFD